MVEFSEQLKRLKRSLGLVEDQEIAEALGMTKAALSARKARRSFPIEKLKLLAAGRPELRLDVKYVLTGITAELERRLEAIHKPNKNPYGVAEEPPQNVVPVDVSDEFSSGLLQDERQLLRCYRQAKPKAKALLLASAVALAGDDEFQST